MELTVAEEVYLDRLTSRFRDDAKVLEMKKYIQHGTVTTYDHVNSVTRLSFFLNRRLHLGADEKCLVTGAFLHDFYLYDWHCKEQVVGDRLHGFSHPEVARKNAVKHFHIDNKVQDIISNHMWPLNITKIPKTREAWIVCIADKYISTKETLLCR